MPHGKGHTRTHCRHAGAEAEVSGGICLGDPAPTEPLRKAGAGRGRANEQAQEDRMERTEYRWRPLLVRYGAMMTLRAVVGVAATLALATCTTTPPQAAPALTAHPPVTAGNAATGGPS